MRVDEDLWRIACGITMGALLLCAAGAGVLAQRGARVEALAGVSVCIPLVLWLVGYAVCYRLTRLRQRRDGMAEEQTPLQIAFPRREPAPISESVKRIYAAHSCGICNKLFVIGGPFVECPDCRQWYHDDCWSQLGGCVTDGCPSAPSKVARRARVAEPGVPAQPVAVARAIHNVGFCPYCQTAIAAGTGYLTCPACKTPYHPECWQENRGCAVYGCNVRIGN